MLGSVLSGLFNPIFISFNFCAHAIFYILLIVSDYMYNIITKNINEALDLLYYVK